jgi:hypothetical protein
VTTSTREFPPADTSNLPVPPISIGIAGPPGGGKSKSALRLADGFARVRGGKPAVIDTEAGRALKYLKGPRNPNGHDFHYIEFRPPFVPADFMAAIKQADLLNPSAIIVDSTSDEHEGEGGYLEWHDREVPGAGGNKWAAWSKPSASRRELIAGMQQIKTPLIFTFRAREKTKQVGKKIVDVGYKPVGGMEVIHTLDLFCLLPPRANGVPLWQSVREGEDFVIKYPEFLAHLIRKGAPLDEDFGEALARWQAGDLGPAPKRQRTPEQMTDDYVAHVNGIKSLDALRTFQLGERTRAWVEGIRTTRPDLHDRIATANSRRASELAPVDEEDLGEPQGEPEARGGEGDEA